MAETDKHKTSCMCTESIKPCQLNTGLITTKTTHLPLVNTVLRLIKDSLDLKALIIYLDLCKCGAAVVTWVTQLKNA
jgi:hypothetical protein